MTSLSSCGTGYLADSGQLPMYSEFAYVKTSQITACAAAIGTLTVGRLIATDGIDQMQSVIELIANDPADTVNPPVPDCSAGQIYFETVNSTNMALTGPYATVAPVFRDCNDKYYLGNVLSTQHFGTNEMLIGNPYGTNPSSIGAVAGLTFDPVARVLETSTDITIRSTGGNIQFHITQPEKTVLINGNLSVTGKTFYSNYESLNIQDNILYMNNGYTGSTVSPGGIALNTNAVGLPIPIDQLGFETNGVVPRVYADASQTLQLSLLQVGDLIQISETPADINSGLYQVRSVNTVNMPPYIDIEYNAALAEPFVQRSFETVSFTDSVSSTFGLVTSVHIGYVGTVTNNSTIVYRYGSNANSMVETTLTGGGGGGGSVTIDSAITSSGFEVLSPSLSNPGASVYTFKRLYTAPSSGITLTDAADQITIANSSPATSVTLTSAGATGLSLVSGSSGPNLGVKRLQAGSNVTLTDMGTYINVSASGTGSSSTTIGNATTGYYTLISNTSVPPNYLLKQLQPGANISMNDTATPGALRIDAATTTLSDSGISVPNSAPLTSFATGPSLEIKRLLGGTGITLTDQGSRVLIDSDVVTVQDAGIYTDEGTAVRLVDTGLSSAPNWYLKTLVMGQNLTKADAGDHVILSAANVTLSDTVPPGASIISDGTGPDLVLKRIAVGTGLSITESATAITLENTAATSAVVSLDYCSLSFNTTTLTNNASVTTTATATLPANAATGQYLNVSSGGATLATQIVVQRRSTSEYSQPVSNRFALRYTGADTKRVHVTANLSISTTAAGGPFVVFAYLTTSNTSSFSTATRLTSTKIVCPSSVQTNASLSTVVIMNTDNYIGIELFSFAAALTFDLVYASLDIFTLQ